MTARLSVVVPTYQRREAARRLLLALADQSLPADAYEVILSIDGSTDGTEEMVRGLRLPYRLSALWQPNGGRAAACNAGLARAAAPLVVLLDDDMEPAADCLAAHLRCHGDGAARGVLGAVPVALSADSPPVHRYIAARFARHLEKLSRAGVSIGPRDFYSGHFSIARDVLARVGGFDEAFVAYGNEDVELALRLRAAGVPLVYCAEARARQHYEKDFAMLARDTVAKGRTAVLCAAKHPDAVREMRITTYGEHSRRWRLARRAVLEATARVPRTLGALLAGVGWLERRRARDIDRWYAFVLDCCFWAGVGQERRRPRMARAKPEPARQAA
jgi:GT2 family glycosyltransferase